MVNGTIVPVVTYCSFEDGQAFDRAIQWCVFYRTKFYAWNNARN